MNDELDDDFVTKKEVLLESEPTNYHEVHCPYYPGDKYEWWYVYLLERKTRKFVTLVPCKTLDKEKTVIFGYFFVNFFFSWIYVLQLLHKKATIYILYMSDAILIWILIIQLMLRYVFDILWFLF